MVSSRALQLLRDIRELCRRRQAQPLKYVRWLPGQHDFLTCRSKRKCYRSGNQMMGKTWAGCAETWWRLTGTHPYRPDLNDKGPVKIVIVGATWPQCNTIMEKMWQLCDRSRLVKGCVFDPAKGAFKGKYPTLRLKNGSIAYFTAAAGEVLSIAGKTVDAVWIDEPISDPRLYSELCKRVARRNGDVYMTFTPVNARIEWLKAECAKGVENGGIHDLHWEITVPNLRFVEDGELITLDDGTPCDQAWLDDYTLGTLEYERPVVIGGDWEFRSEGALWKHYRDQGTTDEERPQFIEGPGGEGSHVIPWAELPDVDWKVCLGIDHGDRAFAACASLVLVDRATIGSGSPRIVVLAEWASSGATTTKQDAQSIIAMLKRAGLPGLSDLDRWGALDLVRGDIPHSGTKRGEGHKSNRDLAMAVALELGIPGERLPVQIRTVRKPPGSVRRGHLFIHNAMLSKRGWRVIEDCGISRYSLRHFDGRPNTPESHQVDAIRYALEEEIRAGGWGAKSRPIIHAY